jgi:hypothetical protein
MFAAPAQSWGLFSVREKHEKANANYDNDDRDDY